MSLKEKIDQNLLLINKAYAELRCAFDESVLVSQSRRAEIDYGAHIEGINGIERRDSSKIHLIKK